VARDEACRDRRGADRGGAEEAIRITLRTEFGATEEGIVTATCRRLGFRRTGAGSRTAVTSALSTLLSRGEVTKDREGFLVLR
jgi:hypothetical protein